MTKNSEETRQADLIMEYFKKHPKREIKQTETGKKMFIRLYELAKATKDEKLLKFCKEVLEVYEENDINGHIVWKR